jgi:signal transduction histidine kinase
MATAEQRGDWLSDNTVDGLSAKRLSWTSRWLDLSASKTVSPGTALLASDFSSFKQQESIFVVLNLFVLAILLLIHTLGSSRWGRPSLALIVVLSAAFTGQVIELAWLQGRKNPLLPSAIMMLTGFSIMMNIGLAFLLAELSHRQDIQYYIVLVVPILEAAFRLPLLPTITVVGTADFITFFWVWEYERHHLLSRPGEYLESGTVSLIFTVVGILVWLLVNHLKQTERRLADSLTQLERARERLLTEEKLAAVGRLSSAIAHEIRNPVAVIASALSTVNRASLQPSEREEMCEIAFKESARLEKLTTDFLTYARPRGPKKALSSLAEIIGYVADVCRARSSEKGVVLSVDASDELVADVDAGQVQQALINLVMNAIEASPGSGQVVLRAVADGNGKARIDVEDAADPIPPGAMPLVFEPFFTTKPGGTGLGLAIARNIARAHGGELILSANRPGCVRFSLTLPLATGPASASK